MAIDIKTIGKRVKSHRVKKKMTQANLAEKLGISNTYISYIETGKKGISLEVLLKIADEFSLSLDSLVFEDAPVRLPGTYLKLMELLAACDTNELEQIAKLVADHIESLREDTARR